MNSSFNNSSNNSLLISTECTGSEYPRRLYSDTFTLIIIIVYSLILLFGMIGNILTCMAVFIHKSMRRSIHVYMLNLAIADIIILLLTIPTQSLLIYNHLEWKMGKNACVVINIIVPSCLSSSIATLIAISIDRYSGVRDPFTWRIKSRRNSKVTIPIIWFLSISAAVPYFIYGGLRQSKREGCRCVWPITPLKVIYMTTMMAIQYVCPFLLIAGMYMHIVWTIARGRESINQLHRRMVKMVVMLLVTYLVCDGMQYIYFYYQVYNKSSQDTTAPYIYIFSNLLLTVQAAINPLIYSSVRDDFNLAFRTLITACGFNLSNMIIKETFFEVSEFRSETDTERMFDYSWERGASTTSRRQRSEISSRKRSLEFVARKKSILASPVHPRKKSSILLASRKHSMHATRKRSMIREKNTFNIDIDPMDSPDYEEGEEPTFRSYRLGTLEFIELEEFHEKMKQEIRKESRVSFKRLSFSYKDSPGIRRISRTLRLISNVIFQTDIVQFSQGGSASAEGTDNSQNFPSDFSDSDEVQSISSKYSNKSLSNDSLATDNTSKDHNKNKQYPGFPTTPRCGGAAMLVNNSLFPINMIVGNAHKTSHNGRTLFYYNTSTNNKRSPTTADGTETDNDVVVVENNTYDNKSLKRTNNISPSVSIDYGDINATCEESPVKLDNKDSIPMNLERTIVKKKSGDLLANINSTESKCKHNNKSRKHSCKSLDNYMHLSTKNCDDKCKAEPVQDVCVEKRKRSRKKAIRASYTPEGAVILGSTHNTPGKSIGNRSVPLKRKFGENHLGLKKHSKTSNSCSNISSPDFSSAMKAFSIQTDNTNNIARSDVVNPVSSTEPLTNINERETTSSDNNTLLPSGKEVSERNHFQECNGSRKTSKCPSNTSSKHVTFLTHNNDYDVRNGYINSDNCPRKTPSVSKHHYFTRKHNEFKDNASKSSVHTTPSSGISVPGRGSLKTNNDGKNKTPKTLTWEQNVLVKDPAKYNYIPDQSENKSIKNTVIAGMYSAEILLKPNIGKEIPYEDIIKDKSYIDVNVASDISATKPPFASIINVNSNSSTVDADSPEFCMFMAAKESLV